MQNRMSNNMGGAKIVTKEDWESEERNVQFDEECFNLNKFWSCFGKASVFGSLLLDRETTFCLVQDQEIKLGPRKQ